MSTLVHLRRPRRPRRSGVLAAAVIASLVLVPQTPAQAAPTGTVTGGTAAWGTSVYLASGTPGRPAPLASAYVAPATFDSTTKISTWGTATGTVNGDGSAVLQLDGTSVNHATTSGHWLKLADLEASLDSAGNGQVTAQVTYGVASGGVPGSIPYNDSTPTRSARVALVNLTGNTAADRTSTPSQTTWAGLDGTWAPELVDFLDGDSAAEPAVPAFAYYTQINSNADRTPLPFTFTLATVAPAVTTELSYVNGLNVDVDGTGFRAVTNPGDAGVYVGLAESGGLPDVSSMEGMDSFVTAAYATPAQIVDGAFSKALTASADLLDPAKDYSVYTWQAHTHSNTSQDTETALEIDWSQLEQPTPTPAASTVTTGGAASKAYGASSTLTASVPGSGSVTLTGVGPAQTRTVAAGTASFTVPASLSAGQYTATFAYSGDASYLSSQATRGLTVTKVAPTLSTSWKKKPTTKKRGKLTLVAGGPAGVPAPGGDVVVKVSRNGVKHTVTGTLVNGSVTVKLPKLGAGTWKVKAGYGGAADYLGATKKLEVRV